MKYYAVFVCLTFVCFTATSALAVSVDRVESGVTYVEITSDVDIDPAFDLLESYIAQQPAVSAGVVNIASTLSFSETIDTRDNVSLSIPSSIELTLVAGGLARAVDLSGTINSGVNGGGTLDVNGNVEFGIYANAPQNLTIGNRPSR